ncbi:MAG: hypothetical protein ACW9W3_02430 [Candidatus Nitrosopumilus sp. bin_68KS]
MRISKTNALLTEICNTHRVTVSQKKFLHDAIQINIEEKRPFSLYDFSNMSPENFRQMILRLRNVISVESKGRPCYYRVNGTPLNKRIPLTHHHTGIAGDRMIRILKRQKKQPPAIHDIKITARSDLHDFISHETMHKRNHSIKFTYKLDYNIQATALVYPDKLQIDLGCTLEPIIYDAMGAVRFSFVLGRLYTLLQAYSNFKASFVPMEEWIITHYHFGIDAAEEYNGQTFHVTYNDFTSGLVRFYSKKKGKKLYPRLEKIVIPKNPLSDELQKMIDKSL